MAHGRVGASGRSKSRRRIAVVTGTRAEYGLLRSTMEAIRDHDGLSLQVVVTGIHLLWRFGRTVNDIVQDGWPIDARVKMQDGNDGPLDQAQGLSRGVVGVARFLQQARTDIVLVLGDRIEALAGALAAVTTGRLLGHIHGGDVAAGDFDDSLRHSISKLAHVHFTATAAARRRLVRMGEVPERVHCVGAPGLDRLMALVNTLPKRKTRTARALVLQHPCGRPAEVEKRVMEGVLEALAQEGFARTILYPNTDRGHRGILQAIEEHQRRNGNGAVRVMPSLRHDAYLRLLAEVDVLVGNSSSGIVEAGSAGTPAVNVGSRQQGRERSGPSVVDADESVSSIRRALRLAVRKRPIRGKATAYGRGRAGPKIARILATLPLNESFRRKTNAF